MKKHNIKQHFVKVNFALDTHLFFYRNPDCMAQIAIFSPKYSDTLNFNIIGGSTTS